MTASNHRGFDPVWLISAALVSVAVPVAFYLLHGDVDLFLGGDGFLWYGVQRTIAGSVPILDFQSYDPGRYYWAAAGARLLDDGILSLRISTAAFQVLGLLCGLLVLRRVLNSPWLLVPAGLMLALWMFPRPKQFESSLSMMAVYVAVRLLEAPSLRRHFASGVFVGMAGFFGRNHGLYCGLAFFVLVLFLSLRLRQGGLAARLAALGGGVLLGISPLLLMLAFVPGFAQSLLDSVLLQAQYGSNIPLPIPWPWRVDYGSMPWFTAFTAFAEGSAFLLIFTVCGLGIILALFTSRDDLLRPRTVLIASSVVGLFYAHHASVRADLEHLAQGIHPVLLGLLAIPAAFGARPRNGPILAVWGLAITLTLLVVPSGDMLLRRYLPGTPLPALVSYDVAGDILRLPPHRAAYLARIETLINERVATDEAIYIATVEPLFYVLFEKTPPVYDVFLTADFVGQERQADIVRSLEEQQVEWALIVDRLHDGTNEFRFRKTHRLVWSYLKDEYELISHYNAWPKHWLFRRKVPERRARPKAS